MVFYLVLQSRSSQMSNSSLLKDEGNQHFKDGRLEEAISCYTQALRLTDLGDGDKAVIYKNRAACYLKQENYTGALEDASACEHLKSVVTTVIACLCDWRTK